MYEGFEIDVRMIRGVAADIGSARKAVPDVAKAFSFIGDGTASEADVDSIKWIEGSDCTAAGIIGYVGDVQGLRQFDLAFFESTRFTAQTIAFPESEIGGPYALCYSFDIEPYQLYSSLVMTVLGITGVTAEAGADGIIVVGATKHLKFSGGGAVEAGDMAVWLSGAKVDSDCLVDSFLDGPQSRVDSSLGADFLIPTDDSEEMAGRSWTLCYQFGTESFKIYPFFTLEAVALHSFAAESGSDDDSVVGYPKTFFADGPGVSVNDQAKWVGAAVTNDAGCESERLANTSSVSSADVPDPMEASTTEDILQASFKFSTPTFGAARLRLCYKHQIEPYHLHTDVTLGIRQLVSASVRALGISQSLSSITRSPQRISFVAYGGMEGDRYKWVDPAGSTESNSFPFESCAEEAEPAAGSSVGIAAGFYQESSFTFEEARAGLMLCYGPGAEPYVAYPSVTMNVYSPVVSAANRTHMLVGRPTYVRLVGTFGITSGDAIKLADNAEGDCDGDAAGGDQTIFYPHATTRGLTEATTGTSDVVVLVSEGTAENRPFKLCYRFGTNGVWEMLDSVSLEAFQITSVSVEVGGGSPVAGDLLNFVFAGTGVVDGDQAKWVSAAIVSDDDCKVAAAAAGSFVSEISGGIAQFSFESDVEYWNLCYKHGYDDWRLYGPTPIATTSTPTSKTTSETQLTKAMVSLTLEGSVSSYPAGSVARIDFEASFLADLSSALRERPSRFQVEGLRAGSVVVDFSISPTGSLADVSVTELLANLDAQIADDSSPLRNGNVTSAAKGIAYTTSVVAEDTFADSTSYIGISVVEYQTKGLFGFISLALYTTEASEKVTLTVYRDHGTKGIMDIEYVTSDGTAVGGDDYVFSSGIARFYDGDTNKTFDVAILDNSNAEQHFKSFQVSLNLHGPINDGAALRSSASTATIYVYDFGDGIVQVNTTFPVIASNNFSSLPQKSSTKSVRVNHLNDSDSDYAGGWTVLDNDEEMGWADWMGFAAKDAVIGADEYDDRCDYAATSPCEHDCPFGGGLAELFPTTGESPSVLSLNGIGFVNTIAEMTDFPSTTFSISVWVRAKGSHGGAGGGVLVSYIAPDGNSGDSEVLLHNLNGICLLVHGKYVTASNRYDGPDGGDLGGIRTGINVARDMAWHHLAVTWRSADGRVEAYIDGARVFDGGPYKMGAEITPGGRFVLGQSPTSECLLSNAGEATYVTSTPLGCHALAGGGGPGGLKAEIQHLRVWSKHVTADEVGQQMRQPFEGNSVGQVLHWDFTPEKMEGRRVQDSSGIGESKSGVANFGLISEQGASLVQATPSLNPAYPCGLVYSGIWRFAAPEEYVTALRDGVSYGGRLQFRLAHTSANGGIRSTRGAVVVRSKGGDEVSWNDIFGVAEAAPGEWTAVSVVLREDHGWVKEPLGDDVSAWEMRALLADAAQLLIRGDMRVFGKEGGGAEVVYLQDVRLLAKALPA